VIQRNVQDPLAEMILAGKVHDGDRIEISAKDGVLTFNGEAPPTAAEEAAADNDDHDDSDDADQD
jgi:ATP-dependent Clp protease ATP-binding subunit ClpB